MRVAVIGGPERARASLSRAALQAGYTVEFHSGHAAGRGSEEIRSMVRRSELVLVLTDCNSHNGVHVARRESARLGRKILLLKRLSLQALVRVLRSGDAPADYAIAS